jgi:hypothetical protein
MSLPMPANVSVDIYRSGNGTNTPDVAAVAAFLQPKGQSTLTTENYTHILYVDWRVDIRDAFTSGLTWGPAADIVYLPAGIIPANATKFQVVLIRRMARGTASDHKQVLLQRSFTVAPPWPTNNL